MHKTFVSLASTCALLFCGACDDPDARSTGSRHGAFVLHSSIDEAAISSQVYRDGELVAEVDLTDDRESITLVADGRELHGAPPDFDPRDDLERYHERIADVSDGLVRAGEAVKFRNECGYFQHTGAHGNLCIASWCGSCHAYDCAPDSNGQGEYHWWSMECGMG